MVDDDDKILENDDSITDSQIDNSGGVTYRRGNIFTTVLLIILIVAALIVNLVFFQRSHIAVMVNGEKITKDELLENMIDSGGNTIVEGLIDEKLILQEAKKLKITVDEEEIGEKIDEIVSQFGSEEEFHQLLEEYGDTIENLQNRIRLQILLEKIILSDEDISDQDLEKYFQENRSMFDVLAEVQARHILVETEGEAVDVVARLAQGEAFGDLARELSLDMFTREDGGKLEPLYKQINEDTEDTFVEAAFALKKGECSAPIETVEGFHIIEVLDKKEGRAVKFSEVKNKVREEYQNNIIDTKAQQLIERLREEAKIKNMYEK